VPPTWPGRPSRAAASGYAAGPRWQPAAVARLAAAFASAVVLYAAWDRATSVPVYRCIAALSLVLLAVTTPSFGATIARCRSAAVRIRRCAALVVS
jgi:hypothetical protein